MPIYTTTPQTFSNCRVEDNNDGQVCVLIGKSGCKVCVMSSKDYGKSYYKVYNDISYCILNKSDKDLTVCITKQNFIPKTFEIKATSVTKSNAKISNLVNTNNQLLVETQIEDKLKDVVLRISSAEGNFVKSYKVSYDFPSVLVDTSAMKSGVYIISLVADGTVVEARQIIRK